MDIVYYRKRMAIPERNEAQRLDAFIGMNEGLKKAGIKIGELHLGKKTKKNIRYTLEGIAVPTERTLKRLERKGTKELRKRGKGT